jgi:hypothetical protein|tara:strand:- start:730 stop:939 length:210 start_codon:yes stop_codon:yes gene_type:complete
VIIDGFTEKIMTVDTRSISFAKTNGMNMRIRVLNDLMAYPDDTREAEMLIAVLKDGQMIRIETGATLVD